MSPGLPIYVEIAGDIRESKYYQYNEEIDYKSIVSCLKEVDVCKADILTALKFMKKVRVSKFFRGYIALNTGVFIYPTRRAERNSISYVHFAINKYNNDLNLQKKKPEIVTKQRLCLLEINPKFSIYSGKKTITQGVSTDIALKFDQNIFGLNFNLIILEDKSKFIKNNYCFSRSGGIGGFFMYQRNIVDLNGTVEMNVGLNAGFMSYTYTYEPDYDDWFNHIYDIIEGKDYLFGGPLANLKIGNRKVHLFTDYSLLLGNTVAQLIGFGISFRF